MQPRGEQASLVRHTLLELLAPRRSLPILIVAAPMVLLEARWSLDRYGWLLGLVMVFSFVAVAPLAWRVLMEDGLDLSHGAIRLILYVGIGVGTVGFVSVGIPYLFDMRPSLLTAPTSMIVCMALFVAGGWGLGRDIQLETRLLDEKARSSELQRVAEQAQLSAIRANLDPHFLFNTLNAIAEWCRIDGAVAESAILKLSALLRRILAGVHQSEWSLAEELRLVQDLFDLHLLRDPALFTVTWQGRSPSDDPATSNDPRVPPMLLLSLVENAIKHGPAAGHRGEVQVRVEETTDSLVVEIENPGAFRGERDGGVGVPLMRRRLEGAYGSRATFSLSAVGDRTRARLILPRITFAKSGTT